MKMRPLVLAQEPQLTFGFLEAASQERSRTVTSAVKQNCSCRASSGAETEQFCNDVGSFRNRTHCTDRCIENHIRGNRDRQASFDARYDSFVKSDERPAPQTKVLTALLMFNREAMRLRRYLANLRENRFTLRRL